MTRPHPWTQSLIQRLTQDQVDRVIDEARKTCGHYPRVLDLYCGAGGATHGYQQVGFTVTGVDVVYRNEYCGDEFIHGGALKFVNRYGRDFDFIHASPPCQAHSTLTKGTNAGNRYPDLIPQTREALKSTGVPYVLENVVSSPLRDDLTLCGEMFRLAVVRHRRFEFDDVTLPWIPSVAEPIHRGPVSGYNHGEYRDGPYFQVYGDGGGKGTIEQWQDAMGIHWTKVRDHIAQAIPPKYTWYIGYHVARMIAGIQHSGMWGVEMT